MITAVEGPTSYEFQVLEGQHRSCAADQLRPYYSPLVGEAWPLFYTRHDVACNPAKPDDWICEGISGFQKQDPKKKDGIPQWKAR